MLTNAFFHQRMASYADLCVKSLKRKFNILVKENNFYKFKSTRGNLLNFTTPKRMF